MVQLMWDEVGKKEFETGVDRGVLYLPNNLGVYDTGVAWSGLTAVTESPSGAESNKQYADNQVYVNILSAEEFGGTIEAFTYPDEFAECDGTVEPSPGVTVGQQNRKPFGFCYRTKVGNDVNPDAGYKLHLAYGALASPSEKNYATVNDSPEAVALSWDFSTTPVPVAGLKPTALLTINSTRVDPAALEMLEEALYGTAVGGDAHLPSPSEVLAMFAGALTDVNMNVAANQPSYVSGTHIVTLPAVTGVQWKINGVNKAPGAQPALTAGQTAVVTAVATAGYNIVGDNDWSFAY